VLVGDLLPCEAGTLRLELVLIQSKEAGSLE
jgi:hypothetical protein